MSDNTKADTKKPRKPRKNAPAVDASASPVAEVAVAEQPQGGAVTGEVEMDMDSKALTMVFCDRLNQAIDRRPDVIRKGRGRTNDFKDRFGLHYTTAHRLLEGQVLPTAPQLQKFANFFGLPIGWFLGEGEPDVDAEISRSNLKIEIFDPHSSKLKYLTAPVEDFMTGFDTGRLIMHRLPGHRGDEVVFVRVQHRMTDGAVHLIHAHEDDTTLLRRLSFGRGPSDTIMAVSHRTGHASKYLPSECNFGERTDPDKKFTIIGPVVAMIVPYTPGPNDE